MNSSSYLVKVQGCPVGTVTTLGTITEVVKPNIDTYVVTFDNGQTVTRRWNQTLTVVA
jgi:hypothetical protein